MQGPFVTLAATLAFAQEKPAAKPTATVHPAVKEPGPTEMGHVHYLDYKNGFRGVKFGSPSSAIPGLSLVRESGAMKIYQKSGDTLTLGACNLDHIYYHFVDDKFMGVSLFPKDVDDGQALREIFEIAFGEGARAKPHADSRGAPSARGRVFLARESSQRSHQLH